MDLVEKSCNGKGKLINDDNYEKLVNDMGVEKMYLKQLQKFKLPKSSYFEQEYYFTIESLDFKVIGTKQDSESNNEYVLWRNHQTKKVHYLYVNNKKKIVNFKIYEDGNKLHTGIVKYGDTVTIKVETRNLVGKELEFEIWKDVKADNYTDNYSWYDKRDDENMQTNFKIKINSEGYGEYTLTIPKDWESKHKGKPYYQQYFYFKNGDSEFPRAYYVANPNTKERAKKESEKQSSLRVFCLNAKNGDYQWFEKKLK